MERDIIKQLIKWKARPDRKPLIMKGARQVGKTFILKKFGEQEFEHTHTFNFEKEPKYAAAFEESLDPKKILRDLSLIQNKRIDTAKDLIIFDEIQYCPKALTSLKYFQEDLPGSYVCAAGSLLGIYLTPVSFPVGKVEHISMYPMTFIEFLRAIDDELSVELLQSFTPTIEISTIAHDHLWKRLKTYFITGGLPEVVDIYRKHQDDEFAAFQNVRSKQEDLIKDYFADIAKHSGKINAMHINRIWQSVPDQLGMTHDGSAPKFKFKDVIPGIDRFSKLAGSIDWLEAAGIIIKVHIAHQSQLPLKSFVQENTFKLFMFDIGILGAMMKLTPLTILGYNYGTYKGFFAENYIAQVFESMNLAPHFSWSEKSAEIEFLRQIEDKIIPIEVKSGWVTKSKSLQVYDQKYQPEYGIIISAQPLRINPSQHLRRYPLYLASFI